MFCKNCGKEIGNDKFCQYCGYCNSKSSSSINFDLTALLKKGEETIVKFGHDRLLTISSIFFMVVSVIIRIVCNEIEVVYTLFVSDDYYVMSEGGKIFLIVMMVIQVVFSVLLYIHARYKNIVIPAGLIVLFIVSIAIQLLMLFVKFPAPY